MDNPVPLELKSGILGVLVTTGVALLAISVLIPSLFSAGTTLLFLGIIGYIIKEAYHFITVKHEEDSVPSPATGILYLVLLVALAVVVFLIFLPLLPL